MDSGKVVTLMSHTALRGLRREVMEAKEVSNTGLHGFRKQVRGKKRILLNTFKWLMPRMSCHCPMLPRLQVLWEPLEFRRKKTKTHT